MFLPVLSIADFRLVRYNKEKTYGGMLYADFQHSSPSF